MRKINNDTSLFQVPVSKSALKKKSKEELPTKSKPTARITFALNANLCQQAENWLTSRWTQHDLTYPSLSYLIRKSLQAYQEKEIKLNETRRDKYAPKREITIRFSDSELLNFYYSLPVGQRTSTLEGCLEAYLERMSK